MHPAASPSGATHAIATLFGWAASVALVLGGCLASRPLRSQDAATESTNATPAQDQATRPILRSNRWQEDWSVLADPALRTQWGDALKYIALSADDPHTYLSFGVNLRERAEMSDAASFGVGGVPNNTYLLQRFQLHMDLRFAQYWQAFVQVEDARTVNKQVIGGADRNPWDLRMAFVAYVRQFDSGTFKARVGRQDFAFDLQRFVSLRDGPNVRQSFDALWADWETGVWRFIGFISQPVQYKDEHPFDDTSNSHFRFSTLRVERLLWGHDELSAYYSLYSRDNAHYLDAVGDERRDVYDMRFAGTAAPLDWDVEGMLQRGHVGNEDIQAWGAGARAGVTLESVGWHPRLGLQLDAASGDRHRNDGVLGTFNPLFPNGYYFTLAGFTGYTNLLHVKPSLTVGPAPGLTLMGAVGFQWRQTTGDAIYVQPNIPLAGTAGEGGRWTGVYGQVRADYAFNANFTGAVEAVHFDVGKAIRAVGGRDGDYLGVELKFMW
ncbi:alginate export family protein [Dyella solisilvae]|uniref:Alginate export family protein n=1 Tax=Dyella solisilvae TaxID=1920168 RepID=A0A370K3Y3_9GAMM|nr:alginate export family protein [Dyella solisilvae]RDI97352.1 alginate export family protein [Dyella solisilvae]